MTAIVAGLLTILGLVILTIGVYGVVRLPDVYTQLHAASKAGFLGVAALLAAAALQGGGAIVARAVLIVALLTVTTPVAAHVVARAAHRRGESLRTPGAVDES
ncbi:MAG: monovalent cation/H(+) antiporter subunit G [Actinobacteria bacterium]|nr:monovalent cation/H(+) antiporter subunit G [Actinomycetota bacterium]